MSRVVVVGGGLAGLTAALRLAERGAEVTLIEQRPRLGGATSSFPRGDLTVDTGQHVFLRCYAAYRALLGRLGVAGLAPVQRRFAVPVLSPGPPTGRPELCWLRRGGLPAPLHLAGGLLRYRPLGAADRLRAARAAGALRRLDPDEPALDRVSLGDWLARHGQRPAAVHALWSLITVAALNAEPAESSLALAARVFRTGLLDRADAADIGVPAVSLDRLHAEPAARLLARLGVAVRLRTPARTVEPMHRGFAITTGRDRLTADAVVVATPHQAAASIVPQQASPTRSAWAALDASPIVNVHVVYGEPVTPLPFAAAVGSPVQWVFDRTGPAGVARGQYLAVSLSAADRWIDLPTGHLRETFLDALARLFPAARRAQVIDFFVTRERRATFRQAPGTHRLRPAGRTELPGLVLAGAWTDTGWPDTMEGAVRSGETAAGLVADHLDRPASRPGAAA